jgi:hypothetical protein
MRSSIAILGVLVAAAAAAPASATTVVVYADPMTLERRMVVIAADGPDRAFLCMLPPSTVGCIQVPVERERR